MTRISLKEAYDNRDVIAQIARLNDIVEDLPNPDLTNVVLKTGNQIIDGIKQFNDQVVLAGGMDLTGLGPTTINGDLEVNGDIIQTGAAYETHAEQVFSKNDYIVMRDEAVSSLPAGSYSGLQVKKYDGVSDCRLVVDNQGVARVGDINDERPIMVRDEVAYLNAGDVLLWDSVGQKAIGQAKDAVPTSGSTACVASDGIYTALAAKADLAPVQHYPTFNTADFTGSVDCVSIGKLVIVSLIGVTPLSTGGHIIVTNLPQCSSKISSHDCVVAEGGTVGNVWIDKSGTVLNITANTIQLFWQTFFYVME